MKDLVKQLIQDPLSLVVLLTLCAAIFGVYCFLVTKAAQNSRFGSLLEQGLFGLFTFNIALFNLPILFSLNPTYFYRVDGGSFWRGVQILIYLLAVVVLNSRFRFFIKNALFLLKDPFLSILLGIVLLSAVWSISPIYTLQSSLVLVGVSAVAAHVSKRLTWTQVTAILRWSLALAAILSLIFVVVQPSFGIDEKGWRGITPQPNRLGPMMALSVVLWLQYFIHHNRDRWLSSSVIILSLIILKFTNSSTSLLIAFSLISLLLLVNFIRRLSLRKGILAVILFFIVNICLYLLLSGNLGGIVESSGKDLTLTGRTDFWPQLIDRIWKRPILGYGFSGFWLPWLGDKDPSNNITTIGGYFRPLHAHNGFLDLAIQTGLIGLTLFVASFIKNATLAIIYIRRNQSFEAVYPLLILVFIVISNITESSLLATNFPWFYYILVTVHLNSYASEPKNLKIGYLNKQNCFLKRYS